MSKQEDLEQIDSLLREKMIELLKSGATEQLSDLSSVIQYVAKNNIVEDKKKTDTKEEEHQKRIKEAKERREKRD